MAHVVPSVNEPHKDQLYSNQSRKNGTKIIKLNKELMRHKNIHRFVPCSKTIIETKKSDR